MTGPLELDDLLPESGFRELHRRTVHLPVGEVWDAATTVLTREIRLLGPLMAIRDVPARLRRTRPTGVVADRSMLAELEANGFLRVREDRSPVHGRAVVLHCAAGRFWSPFDDAAATLRSVDDFFAHTAPRSARVATSLEVRDQGDRTELITETRIVGTDAAAHRTFRRYWVLIRFPSGMIRCSWLAAIDPLARRSRSSR